MSFWRDNIIDFAIDRKTFSTWMSSANGSREPSNAKPS